MVKRTVNLGGIIYSQLSRRPQKPRRRIRVSLFSNFQHTHTHKNQTTTTIPNSKTHTQSNRVCYFLRELFYSYFKLATIVYQLSHSTISLFKRFFLFQLESNTIWYAVDRKKGQWTRFQTKKHLPQPPKTIVITIAPQIPRQ